MRENYSTVIFVRVTLNKNQDTVDLVTGRSFFYLDVYNILIIIVCG